MNSKAKEPVRKWKIPHEFTRMWSLRNKVSEQRGKKRQTEEKKQTQILSYKERTRGAGCRGRMKQETDQAHPYPEERWLQYGRVGSLYCTMEINTTLHVNDTRIKLKASKWKIVTILLLRGNHTILRVPLLSFVYSFSKFIYVFLDACFHIYMYFFSIDFPLHVT